jgi:hypothetical protein
MAQSKYRAQPTTVNGIRYASKKEAKRCGELHLLQRLGEIRNLELQPKFPLKVNGELVCTYIADASYRDAKTGNWIVEDVKSPPTRTPVYRLKIKLLRALHPGIDHREV